MKNTLLITVSFLAFFLSSCSPEEVVPPVIPPAPLTCIETIILDLQENDEFPDCTAFVRSYSFDNAIVYAIGVDLCMDGDTRIIDEDCNFVCRLNGFAGVTECGDSANFHDDAEFIELLWEEEN